MIDAAERLIERQSRALARTAPEALLFVIAPFLRALREDPSLRVHLDDLERDAEAQAVAYAQAVEPLVTPISRAWDRLAAAAQTAGNEGYLQRGFAIDQMSHSSKPIVISMTRGDGFHTDSVHRGYLAAKETFDELLQARKIDEPIRPVGTALIEIGSRLQEATGVLNVQARRPSFSLLRLMAVTEYMPDTQRPHRPLFAEPGQDRMKEIVGHIEVRPLLTGADLTVLAASRQPDLDFSHGSVQRLVAGLADDLAVLHDELALALGTVRSRLALIDRFVTRCERYDRQRLVDLADRAHRPEAVLRDELARYLFDAGLDPLTEASLATTRADVLDLSASPVLIEAKQYKSGGKETLTKLIQEAYLQTVDTAAELRTRAVLEAFVVVIRRAGGRRVLPEESVRLGSTDYWFRLVDLAPSKQTGSGAKEAVTEMTVDDITRAADDAAAGRPADE